MANADISIWFRFSFSHTFLATVVLPVPGVPENKQIIIRKYVAYSKIRDGKLRQFNHITIQMSLTI